MALVGMRFNYEFTLKEIEVDNDVREVFDKLGGGFATGYEYKWRPDKLTYINYSGLQWYFAYINRETLTYTITTLDLESKDVKKVYYDGTCKIIKLEKKF